MVLSSTPIISSMARWRLAGGDKKSASAEILSRIQPLIAGCVTPIASAISRSLLQSSHKSQAFAWAAAFSARFRNRVFQKPDYHSLDLATD
jgi:hypothetical protein